MWRIFEFIVITIIVLVFITEIFIPTFQNKPLFGSFRKSKDTEKDIRSADDIKQKISKAKEKVKDVRSTQNEVDEFFDKAQRIKDESDNLL
jgi:membrane-associated HD superfamily phosphohydrolase